MSSKPVGCRAYVAPIVRYLKFYYHKLFPTYHTFQKSSQGSEEENSSMGVD